MNALWGLLLLAGLIYGIVIDATLLKIYFTLIVLWAVFIFAIKDKRDNSKRKTLLISTWGEPSDPTSYIVNDVSMSKSKELVKQLNSEQSEVRYTLTHLVGYATGWGLYKMRKNIGRIMFGTFYHTKDIGTTVLVDVEGGKDLVPVTIWNVHNMTLKDYAKAVGEKVGRAKKGKDEAHKKSTAAMDFVPSFIAEPMLFSISYLGACCGFDLPPLCSKRQFGHILVTNIGTLGYNSGFAPICPPMHAMALICTGTVEKRPVVNKDGEIVVDEMMTVVATGDHRYGDASIFIPFFKAFLGYLTDPNTFDLKGSLEHPHWSEAQKKTQ